MRAEKRITRVTFLLQKEAIRNAAAGVSNPAPILFLRLGLCLSAVILLLLQSGCMTAGEQLDRVATDKLQKGQPLIEVRKLLGTPKKTETGADGKRLDFYQVIMARRIPGPNRGLVVRSLCVLYDDKAHVEDFVRHVGELLIRQTPLGWEAGEPLDAARIRGIQRETHSRQDMVFTFGPPTVEGLDRNGNTILAWYFITGSTGFFSHGTELLTVFDSSNRVKDYSLREIQP